jgi:hypothetical protein
MISEEEKITKEELIRKLEEEAEQIHRSTKVNISIFSPLHNYLRSKSSIYYKWSIMPRINIIHLTIVLGFIFSILFVAILQFAATLKGY